MKLKTFRANSMADALAAVKTDIGRDAVILHTRTIKTGGFLGFGRRTAVEVTASDEAPSPRKRPSKDQQEASTPCSTASTSRKSPQVSASETELDVASDLRARPLTPVASAVQAYSKSSPTPAVTPAPTPAPRVAAPAIATPDPSVTVMRVRERSALREPPTAPAAAGPTLTPVASAADIRRELSDIKLLVTQVLKSSGPSTPASGSMAGLGSTPDALFTQYLKLLEAQVGREIADRIVGQVRDELHPGELRDESIVRTTVLRHLSSMIQVAPPSRLSPRGGGRLEAGRGPFVVALVGPTGVGKTTTVAKLAATYKLRQGRSVGLITSDTYRIAAVDQLRTYADIIGLPLRVVQTPAEMAAAVQALSSLDVVLVDTAGRSQHNTERISELASFVNSANPDETHLVLSSTAAPEVLYSAADAFSVVKPNRVILTKLDEAVHFGVVVNIMQRLSTQLSFITTGQEVPDHIEPGNPDRIARLIMDRPVGAAPAPVEAAVAQPPVGLSTEPSARFPAGQPL